jgi:Zn-dependent metalloprotease
LVGLPATYYYLARPQKLRIDHSHINEFPEMKALYPILLILLSVLPLAAQTGGKSVTNFDKSYSFSGEEKLTELSMFGLDGNHHLQKQYEHKSLKGKTHHKYQQFYHGLRVLGGTVVYHLEQDRLYATSGLLHEFSGISMQGKITIAEGENMAKLKVFTRLANDFGSGLFSAGKVDITNVRKAVANTKFPAKGGEYTLVYVYTVEAEGGALPVNMDVILDARTGRTIATLSNINTEGAIGHGDGYYHQNLTFPTDSIAEGQYLLRDLSRGKGVIARDISNHFLTPTDTDNEWGYQEDGQAAMVDGYYASVKFHDFLRERFNRNSIDDDGFELVANMNRHTLVNAFWNRREATFGNGDCDDYSALTTFDIVGHEYAHGLTQFTSGLIYFNESGALNESISDIMGKGLEYYYDQEHFNWLLGKLIVKGPNGSHFRSMEAPHRRNHPSFYKGAFWRYDLGDNAGVHSKSGVFNFWFYLLAEGDSGTNQANYDFEVAPIGMDSALQLVYLLETAYLTESSGYLEAYELSKMAATDLFGADSAPYASMIEAWKAVGIDDETTPVEPEAPSLELNVFYQSSNPSEFDFCPLELEHFTALFINESDSIVPAGSLVNGRLIFRYTVDGTEQLDTSKIVEQVLSEPLQQEGRLEIPVGVTLSGITPFIFVTNQLDFTTPDSTSLFETDFQNFISVNATQEISFAFSSTDYSDPCEASQEIIETFFAISLPRCFDVTNGTFRFTYKTLTDEVSYERELIDDSSGRLNFFNIQQEVDLNRLGDLNEVDLEIAFITDEATTILWEEDFSSYFATSINEPTVEDFSDETLARRLLAIELCPSCTADYSTEALILTDQRQFYNPEECIPLEEFMNSSVENEDARITTITLCVDATNIANPYLSFDITLQDTSRRTRRQNLYQHITDVYSGGVSMLTEPISTTGNELREVEVRLGDGFAGEIELHVVSSEVKTTIDNLSIVSGSPSSTRRLDARNYQFVFANPVSSSLEISSVSQVPANTFVRVFSTSGQLVGTTAMTGHQASFDLSRQPVGLYFVTISDGLTFSWTGKVVRR